MRVIDWNNIEERKLSPLESVLSCQVLCLKNDAHHGGCERCGLVCHHQGSAPSSNPMALGICRFISYLAAWLSSLWTRFVLLVLSTGPIPNHIAFVMDGNRRYARRKGEPVSSGHDQGSQALRRVRNNIPMPLYIILNDYPRYWSSACAYVSLVLAYMRSRSRISSVLLMRSMPLWAS